MANRDIKLAAAGAGVRIWQIADRLGMRDNNLSRKLRYELSDEEKEKILAIIKELAERGEGNDEQKNS